jgi:hypothetical protein
MATQFLLKDKIKATKYYETSTPINSDTGKNEADICLSLINSTPPSVNNTFLGGEQLSTPGTNLKFTDPTGSICSQTFAIASIRNENENIEDEIVKDDILIGIDKDSNPINTFISKDSNSEPFLDNYLKIETTKNLGPFNSTDSLFQATFKEDSSDLLSMAVNSAYNQDDKKGLLKIAEDTTHNNSYALGKNTSKYFTENANSKQLEVHDISSDNRVSTNKIDIQTIPNNTHSIDLSDSLDLQNIQITSNNLIKTIVFSQISNNDAFFHLSELALYDSNNNKLVWNTDFTLSLNTNFHSHGDKFDYLFDNDKITFMHSENANNVIFTITITNSISLSKIYIRNRYNENSIVALRLNNYKLNFYDANNNSLTKDILLRDIPSLYNAASDYSADFFILNDTDLGFGTFKFVTAKPQINVTTSADVTTLPLLLAPTQINPNTKTSNITLNSNNLVNKIIISDLVNGVSDYLNFSELALYDSNNKKLVWNTDFTLSVNNGFFISEDEYGFHNLFDNIEETIMLANNYTIFTLTFTNPNGVSLSQIYFKNRSDAYSIRLKPYKLNFYDVANNSLSDDVILKDIPSLYSEADDYSVLFKIDGDNNSSINYTNLPSSLTTDEYKELFGDSIDTSFKIEVTKNQNTGFNFVNSSDNTYANLINNTIVDNVDYVKNIASLTHSLEIAQEPMRIDSDINNSDDNSEYFSLSTNGEKLSSTNYNTDGEIKLGFDAPNNRIGTIELPAKSKLRAHYKFNADSVQGNKVANYASDTPVYDATLMNGASISTTDYKMGNGSLQLNGSLNQFLEQSPFTYSSEGFSVAIWFKSNNSGFWARIMDYGVAINNNNVGITVNMAEDNLLRPFLNDVLGGDNVNYNNNEWTHLVLTINPNGQWKTYINGVLNTTNNSSYPALVQNNFVYLGKSLHNIDAYFNGLMDEYLMYDTVLTAQDVSQLYSYIENTQVNSENFEVIVDYDTLTEELKTTKDVSYELIDYLLPTGQGQYGSLTDSNGASLYTNMDEYSTVNFTSSIDVDNSIKLIKITPTFNVDAVAMYKLNDDDSLGNQVPVDITATLSELSNIPDGTEFRTKLLSKKISDLDIQSVNNDLLIQDTTNPTIDSNKWNLYFEPEYNNEYLMSSLLATSNSSNFPLVDKSTSMINNNESLDVTLSYVTVTSSNNTGMLFDSVNIKYDDITTEISQQSLEFFNESEKTNYYELLTDTNVNDYHIVKYVITEQYQAKFMFPLSVFGNIVMTTPLLNSVITTYLYYPKSETPSKDTVITIGANNDTITASKNKVLIPSISTDITNLYKSTDVVSLAGSNTNDNVVLNFSINKKSLTPMNAVFQIKSSESESWENIGNIITDIDTYYGANQIITNVLGNSVNVIICPTITTNTDETLQLIDETYAITLQTNVNNLNLSVTGYEYPISDSLSLDVLTDPNDFINNDLPIGIDMELSVDYSATFQENSGDYSLIIYVKDGNNTIATINMEISSFFGAFVIAKNLNPYFYVDRTLTADSTSFKNGDFSESNPTSTPNAVITSNNNLIPGWNAYCHLIPTNNSWSFPTFLHGANAIVLQNDRFIEQTIYLNIGTHTVSFWLVGRPGGGPNPINIQLNGTTINTISPPTTVWTNYSVTFTVSAAGNNTIRFAGTNTQGDLSCALQDVSITTTTFPDRYFVIGDESVSNGSLTGVSSGVIDMSDGVKINYTDLTQDEYLKFNLLSDKISVSNVGSAGTPQYITHLDYESTNSEKVSIAYYRGYLNSNATTQTYKIVRKDLVTAKVKATDTYVSNITGLYVNKEQVINFNDTISIGNKIKLLFSRLPNDILEDNKYIMNINVLGDSVKITTTTDNIETVINKTLLDYLLYDFNTGTQLISKGIQISANLNYSIVYKAIGGKIYYVNNYKTNPSDIDWPSEHIVNLDDVTDLTSGTTISNKGLDENGYIKFTLSTDTLLDKTSYLVYAPPYLYATQATKYASNEFPFSIADNVSELKTVYFSTTDYSSTELNQTTYLYNPFANITNTNNVTFKTLTIKPFADYNDSSKNIGVQTINITGSNIKLTELKSTNPDTPSNNGPNRNGIIYNGKIGDLTNFSSNYIKLLSNDDGVFQISYTQDLGGQFEQIFGNDDVTHRGNIVINIGNSVLSATNVTLYNQVSNGSIVNIYDVYQVNRNNTLELYLLKYVYDTMIDYANIPGNTYLKRFPGSVDKFYYSQVSIPLVNLGDNINNVLKTITKSNLSLNSDNIVWTEKTTFNNDLSLQITPLTQDGAIDMITLFYTSKEVPTNYTIVNIPNAYEVINGDGTYQTIITGLGKIKTQNVNTSNTPANIDIDLSLPNNLTSNYGYNNSALYDNDIPLDTELKSIDDILFKFE